MTITFIRLNMFEHISSDAMKPILFSIIKNHTPKDFDIEFIDERVEKLPEKKYALILSLFPLKPLPQSARIYLQKNTEMIKI